MFDGLDPQRALHTRQLEVLLRDVVGQRHGPTAERVLDAVIRLQSATLAALCAQLPDLAPNAVRQQVASLMKHEAVQYAEANGGTYSASFGTGVLPALFPLIERYVAHHYHQAGQLVAQVLFELHDQTPDAILKQILRTNPDVESAAQRALTAMLDDETLVAVPSAGPSVVTPAAAAGLAPAVAAASGGARVKRERGDTAAVQLNWAVLLAGMRAERLKTFVGFRHGAAAERVIAAFVGADANRPSLARTARGFPKLHQSSSPVTTGALQKRCVGLQPSMVLAAVDMFQCDPLDSFLISSATSANNAEASLAVSYTSAVRLMKRDLYEGIVLTRHGIVGSRITRLLSENQAMEDRFIAEEALVTHADARTVLTAMLRDGFVKLLELPRGNIAERIPKNSVFLWTLHVEQLLETVQVHVCKAVTNARTALTQEMEAFRVAMPPAYFVDPASTILSQAEAKLVAKHTVQKAALQRALVALLERLLVVLYF